MGLIGLGLVMVNVVVASGQKFELYQLHKSYGFLFGLLLAIRLFWKLLAQRPRPLDTAFMQKSATANQYLMLSLLALMIASGYALACFSIIPIPINVLGWNVPSLLAPDMMMEQRATAVHHYIAFGLTALILVHSAAALFHHFVLKDKTLQRMLAK
jgi:cytochrome b561